MNFSLLYRHKKKLLLLFFVFLLFSYSLLSVNVGAVSARQDDCPTSTARDKQNDGSSTIDISHANEGSVLCRYVGNADKAIAQVIKHGSDREYNFNLATDGSFIEIPFLQGDGLYSVTICGHEYNTTYRKITETTLTVTLDNRFSPFLCPNPIVNYSKSSLVVAKSHELTQTLDSDVGKISAIYNYVIENILYDTDKVATVKKGYIPNVDEILTSGKGICYDYAVLAAAMLRTQGIPTKVQVGYLAGGKYHAWISVYSTDTGTINDSIQINAKGWTRLDPTFATNTRQFPSITDSDYSDILFEY